jgi:hypothetical protein
MFKFAAGIWVGLVFAWAINTMWPESSNEYKKGQIDALNGKISFELKVQEDKTTRWERIK